MKQFEFHRSIRIEELNHSNSLPPITAIWRPGVITRSRDRTAVKSDGTSLVPVYWLRLQSLWTLASPRLKPGRQFHYVVGTVEGFQVAEPCALRSAADDNRLYPKHDPTVCRFNRKECYSVSTWMACQCDRLTLRQLRQHGWMDMLSTKKQRRLSSRACLAKRAVRDCLSVRG